MFVCGELTRRPSRLPLVLIALMFGTSACLSSGEPPDRAEVDDGQRRAVAVLEPGGPVNEREIRQVVEFLVETLADPDGGVDVFVVDGPNADVIGRLALPGVTAEGTMDTPARNRAARLLVAERLHPAIEEAITAVFADSTVSLDDGRDLLGALDRAGELRPDELVLLSSSGGIHRTSELDFLDGVGEPAELDLPEHSQVTLLGVGDVPVGADQVPQRDLTSALVEYWQGVCEVSPPTDCEVLR